MAPRVVIIAIGGPTCSGKTTLAKHLARILPNAVSLFQDDFAPPAEQVPWSKEHGVQDWDDAAGAIQWPLQRSTIAHLATTGTFPSAHYSHDHLNAQIPVPIPPTLASSWTTKFLNLDAVLKEKGDEVQYVIADGFLMLVDMESVKHFDVRLFVREDYATLKQRRVERHGYHTAVQSDPEGALWRDPPDYWDNIVWPAYLKAHRPLFLAGDVEQGSIDSSVIEGVELLEARNIDMGEMVRLSCERIYGNMLSGHRASDWKKP